ncbi:MAG: hypothetical protein IJL24_03865, partial [Treponema sp.]|nr:hypothetical protein [Treponema sp.]
YLFLARGELSEPGIFSKIGWGPRILNVGDAKMADWVYPFTVDSSGKTRFSPKYKDGRNLAAPSGTPEFVNALTLFASYSLNEWLGFAGQASLAVVLNSGHKSGRSEFSFEFVLGTRVKFTKITKKHAGKKENAQNVSEN